MMHRYASHRVHAQRTAERRLCHNVETGGLRNSGEPHLRSFADVAENIDDIQGNVDRQMHPDYSNALHEAHNYQQKMIQYYTQYGKFLHSGHDRRTGTSLGPQISINGSKMGHSLAYAQSELNKNARRPAHRRMPDWKIQEHQMVIAKLAPMQMANTRRHMEASLALFSSQKAEQLGLEQDPLVDRGIQQTVERRQEKTKAVAEIGKAIAVIVEAIAQFLNVLGGNVSPSDQLTPEALQTHLATRAVKKRLESIAQDWDMPVDELIQSMQGEKWSVAKVQSFLDASAKTGAAMKALKEKLKEGESKGLKWGTCKLTMHGIRLEHPVSELHRLFGVSHQPMPVIVSFARAMAAIRQSMDGYQIV